MDENVYGENVVGLWAFVVKCVKKHLAGKINQDFPLKSRICGLLLVMNDLKPQNNLLIV